MNRGFLGGLLGVCFAASFSLGLGCGSTASTGVVVEVQASDALADQVRFVRLRIRSGPPDAPRRDERQRLLAVRDWPVRVALQPRDGDASRRYEVTAEGFAEREADEPLVRVRVESGFVAGQWRRLTLWLRAACRGVLCPEAQSCGLAGRCVPTPRRDPDALPPLGTPRVVDGGGPDGGGSDGGGSDGGGSDGGSSDGGGSDGGGSRMCPERGGTIGASSGRCDLRWLRVWRAEAGCSEPDPLFLSDVAVSGSGDEETVAVVGRFGCEVDLGGGVRSPESARPAAFVAAYRADGCHRWDRVLAPETVSGAPEAGLEGVAGLADGFLAAGWMRGEVDVNGTCCGDPSEDAGVDTEGVLLRLSIDGSVHNARPIRGASADPDEVRVLGVRAAGGDVVAWGRFGGTVLFGRSEVRATAPPDAFALHLDAMGNHVADSVLRLGAVADAAGAALLPMGSSSGSGASLGLLLPFSGMGTIEGGTGLRSEGVDTLLYAAGRSPALVRGPGSQRPPSEGSGLLDVAGSRILLALETAGGAPSYGRVSLMGFGSTSGVLVLALADGDLSRLWFRALDSAGEDAVRVLRVAGGAVWVGGSYGGSGLLGEGTDVPPPSGGPDAFLVALDPNDGTTRRLLTLQAQGRAQVQAMAVAEERLYVAGSFEGAWLQVGGVAVADGEGGLVPFLARFDCPP